MNKHGAFTIKFINSSVLHNMAGPVSVVVVTGVQNELASLGLFFFFFHFARRIWNQT